jgi:hypothetical protein
VLLLGPRQAGDCAVTRIWARWDNVLAAKGRLNSRYTDDAEMICNCVFQRTISPEHFLSAPTYLQGAQRSKNTIEAAAGQRNERRNKQVLKYGTEVETKPNRLARSHLIIWYPELHSKSGFFSYHNHSHPGCGELEACDVNPQEVCDIQIFYWDDNSVEVCMSSLSPLTCKTTTTLPAVSLLEQHIPFDKRNVEVCTIYFEKYEDVAPLAQEKATSPPCQRKSALLLQ